MPLLLATAALGSEHGGRGGSHALCSCRTKRTRLLTVIAPSATYPVTNSLLPFCSTQKKVHHPPLLRRCRGYFRMKVSPLPSSLSLPSRTTQQYTGFDHTVQMTHCTPSPKSTTIHALSQPRKRLQKELAPAITLRSPFLSSRGTQLHCN